MIEISLISIPRDFVACSQSFSEGKSNNKSILEVCSNQSPFSTSRSSCPALQPECPKNNLYFIFTFLPNSPMMDSSLEIEILLVIGIVLLFSVSYTHLRAHET